MQHKQKRRHHFVPRFYLRHWANSSTPGSIALWNLRRQLYVKRAAISDQAYKVDLYGQDSKIEEALASLESRVSPIIAAIDDSHTLPPVKSDERVLLRLYAMFQAERTYASASDSDRAAEAALSDIPNRETPPLKQRMTDAALERLSLLTPALPLIFDLEMKLLINKSPNRFVTSDNPVIRYNQFLEARRWPGSGAGWAVPGLQIFLPVSPDVLLLLYDRDLYKVGDENSEAVDIDTTGDTNWLNGLQYLIAEENIYLAPEVDEFYALRMHRRWAGKRRPRFSVTKLPETNPDPKSSQYCSLIVTSMNELKLGLSLSFLGFRIPPESRKLGPTMWNPRNAYVESILEEIYGRPEGRGRTTESRNHST
jgi:hypothetical protein